MDNNIDWEKENEKKFKQTRDEIIKKIRAKQKEREKNKNANE